MSRPFPHPLHRTADTRPGGTGSRVRSPQVTVFVGPEREPFSVYKDVICRSSVFAAMLIYPVEEDWEHNTIHLPEDRPEEVQYIIEYLLSNNYQTEFEREFETGVRSFEDIPRYDDGDPIIWKNIVKRISKDGAGKEDCPKWTSPEDSHRLREWIADRIRSKIQGEEGESQNRIDKRNAWKYRLAFEHISLYVLAQRYDLPGLQKLAYKKMIKHIDWRSSPRSVFDLAATVYPNILDYDDILRPRMRKRLHAALEWISEEKGMEECDKVFGHYMSYGGTLAKELRTAYLYIAEKDYEDQFSSRSSSSTPSIMSSEEWHDAFTDYMPL